MRERIVDKMIDHLKFEINYLQSEVLSASFARDDERCRKALLSQTYAIESLQKAVDAKFRISLQR